MIHVKHAATSYQNVVVNSENIDVFVILLSLHSQVPTRILLRRGKGNAVRLIDIPRLRTILGQDVCQALTDVQALNLINKSHEYRQLFTSFGHECHVEAFTCDM